ncbi:MAG: valine--tRNA ligase [Bacteroidetes bacterium]|nr:valine--tRNA ligase [Bacteroidota bacterium]
MEISSKYLPKDIENKWYQKWLDNHLFKSTPDQREPYTIVIPPPNVTGVLHMGHMLNNTIQDVLIRRARMLGKNACWVPGTDHASIATEAKVVNMLKEKGIEKKNLSRAEFLAYAMDWKEKYGGIILEQLKKLGCSCDWSRTRFTMEPSLSSAVINVFVEMYNKGLIYRGSRMVNWDPAGKTALSDEEVIFKEVDSQLYYVKYCVPESEEFIVVATTRPETILGDTAVCVNPNDERYKKFEGKNVIVPIVNRIVPVIFDEYVDIDYGTGALKVTPAHDINDYNLGLKHKLEIIDCFNEDGTMSNAAGFYIGQDRFIVRKQISIDLKNKELLVKTENIRNKVGFSERTNAIIEPRISKQWFVEMKKFLTNNPEVLQSVLNDEIKFYPSNFKNTYRHWLENIKDWCISRQLWWGHQIPAWYDEKGNTIVAKSYNEAIEIYKSQFGVDKNIILTQDDDVLDTWFSSWLWPISVFDGFENSNNEDIKYYYPTNDLVTAPEIIFFWVARMIMAGYEFRGEKPFRNVYFTGIVRDKLRRKMSKSLGNSPEPIDLIEKFGADGVRMGMLLCSPAGNDILFDESQVEQGRNFCNKIWNAYRLIKSWKVSESSDLYIIKNTEIATKWIENRINKSITEINDCFEKYKLSEALMITYKLIWDDFCSLYLEMIKPEYGEPIYKKNIEKCILVFEKLLKLLHPFMPFITEEIRSNLISDDEKFINNTSWPKLSETEKINLDKPIELIGFIRNKRNENGISPKIKACVTVNADDETNYKLSEGLIKKLGNVSNINFGLIKTAISGLVEKDQIFVEFEGWQPPQNDKDAILKEINYLKGFLQSVELKLSNEKFITNAKPELVMREKQKRDDAISKIESLSKQL